MVLVRSQIKTMLVKKTCRTTCEGICLCTKQWYIGRGRIDIKFTTVFTCEKSSFTFSSGYMIPPRCWGQFIECAFSMHQEATVKLEEWRL